MRRSQVTLARETYGGYHSKRWVIDRATLRQARAEDLQYLDDPEYLDFFSILFANGEPCTPKTFRRGSTLLVITELGKKLNFRQRVIATAIVFFRRFYVKNSYCEIDPFIVIAACCYVAGKAEESPVHIKNMVAEARLFFSRVCHRNVSCFWILTLA